MDLDFFFVHGDLFIEALQIYIHIYIYICHKMDAGNPILNTLSKAIFPACKKPTDTCLQS